MNTILNFEIAKLLKEKGFHEPTYQSYRTLVVGEDDPNWWKVGELNKRMYCKFGDHNDAYFGICSAPTIAEVVMWLYEKHGIWVQVVSHNSSKSIVFKYELKRYEWDACITNEVLYISPTEAYSEAILYTLNNLI